MDDEIRKAIGLKYQKGIDDLLVKYGHLEDDELHVIDILNSEEDQTFVVEEISFIKSSKKQELQKNYKMFLFSDVYKTLCSDCDFEDVYLLLK